MSPVQDETRHVFHDFHQGEALLIVRLPSGDYRVSIERNGRTLHHDVRGRDADGFALAMFCEGRKHPHVVQLQKQDERRKRKER